MTSATNAIHTYENVGFSDQVEHFNAINGVQPTTIPATTAVAAVATNNGNGNSHTTTMQFTTNKNAIESPFPDPTKNDPNLIQKSSNADIVSTTEGINPLRTITSKAPVVSSAVNFVTNLMPSGNSPSPMESIREWSVSTFKCTKQLINEKRGKCTMTNDVQLKEDIELLRINQKKLILMLNTVHQMNNHYIQLVRQQKQMQELMNELSLKFYSTDSAKLNSNDSTSNRRIVANFSNLGNNLSTITESPIKSYTNEFSPILEHIKSSNLNIGDDFKKNAIALNATAKNGEKLVIALTFFCSNLSTLVYKTIEDTLTTVKKFELVRLEYDAERNFVNFSPPTAQTSVIYSNEKLESARSRYEQLREDVQIKMKFLEENILKVMHKQLLLFNGAFSAYSNGNTAALESTLKNFSIL